MPLYSLMCPDCGIVNEHFMGVDDTLLVVECPECGHGLTRKSHRHYMSDIPQIQGDTVAGGCNYNYYDENLECQITSKQHRKNEMAKQGLRDYSPDPEMRKFRDEQVYVLKHTERGDRQAAKEIHKKTKAATQRRRERAIDEIFDKAPLPEVPDI